MPRVRGGGGAVLGVLQVALGLQLISLVFVSMGVIPPCPLTAFPLKTVLFYRHFKVLLQGQNTRHKKILYVILLI